MTKQTQLRFGLAVLLGFSLSGCFKSYPPVKTEHYSLPEVATQQPTTTQTPTLTRTLALGSLQLADYLDTDRIIIQTDDITMQPARDHLWVDNLSQELRRGLRARLASRLGNTLVVDRQPGLPATNTLHLNIEQFHGQMRGYAVLSGQWQLISANQVPGSSRAFKFSTPLAENGYPALIRALGQDLNLLSEEIASQLKTLP